MRKLIAFLGGLSLMSSIGISTVGCVDQNDQDVFVLKTDIGQTVDSFNKMDVIDYYFPWYSANDSFAMTEIVINFKSETKSYGQKPGFVQVYLKQLIEGLRMKPDQEKYNAPSIPAGVWKNIGWWDYTNDRPKDL